MPMILLFYVESLQCFASFIQSNKKKLRQDASNRNPNAGVTDPPVLDQSAAPELLCLRHLTLVGGEEEKAVVEEGGT